MLLKYPYRGESGHLRQRGNTGFEKLWIDCYLTIKTGLIAISRSKQGNCLRLITNEETI